MVFRFPIALVSLFLFACGNPQQAERGSSEPSSSRSGGHELHVQVFFPEALQKQPKKMQTFLAQSRGLRVNLSTSKSVLCEQWTELTESTPVILKGCLEKWASETLTLRASLYGQNRAFALATGRVRIQPDVIERKETVVLKLSLKVPIGSLK